MFRVCYSELSVKLWRHQGTPALSSYSHGWARPLGCAVQDICTWEADWLFPNSLVSILLGLPSP